MSDNSDRYRPSFSEREGFEKSSKSLGPGEIGEKARKQLWNKLYETVPTGREELSSEYVLYVEDPWYDILKDVHTDFFELTSDTFTSSAADFFQTYKSLICGSDEDALPFNKLFDLLEFIIVHPMCPSEFVDEVAETFEKCRLAYRVNKTHPASIYLAEDEVIQKTALEPALAVLAEPPFKVADDEFRSAMREYENGNYADCLVKCGSTFESVLKVICKSNGWSFARTNAAVKTVVGKCPSLAPFFERPLMLIATMRNELSTAHGGGDKPRAPRRSVARYAVASTAAAIVLLVSESGILETGGEPDDM